MDTTERMTTGVPGFNEILHGGLIVDRTYLVRGEPGTGKTILGLHFLQAGVDLGEPVLLVSLSETEATLRHNARQMGFDVDAIPVLDLTPASDLFAGGQTYDIFSPAEVERDPITSQIVNAVERIRPRRIYVDAITQLRYLSPNELEFRRHMFSFLRFLTEQRATTLVSSDYGRDDQNLDSYLRFMCDGVIGLSRESRSRYIEVEKFRGSGFDAGPHAARIDDDGFHAFPRLIPEVHSREFVAEAMPTGVAEVDAVLDGGLERGTVTIVTGPVGTGKTTLSLSFAKEAARHGERTVVYLFEESVETLLHRSRKIGTPVDEMLAAGNLILEAVEPLRLSADEFAVRVREEVEQHGTRILILDSIAGYYLSLRGETPVAHLHALTRYLRNMGVTTLVVSETEWLMEVTQATSSGISYMADNIIMLRYFERGGELRKVLNVLKKRVSGFDPALHEFIIDADGIHLGAPLADARSVVRDTGER